MYYFKKILLTVAEWLENLSTMFKIPGSILDKSRYLYE